MTKEGYGGRKGSENGNIKVGVVTEGCDSRKGGGCGKGVISRRQAGWSL